MTRLEPSGEFEEREAERVEAGDRVWIDGRWQTVEAAGKWPASAPREPAVELTTEPYSEGHVFEPRDAVLVATGEVGERIAEEEAEGFPEDADRFSVEIRLGNAAVSDRAALAGLLRAVAADVSGWESNGDTIRDANGNTVGSYTFLAGD